MHLRRSAPWAAWNPKPWTPEEPMQPATRISVSQLTLQAHAPLPPQPSPSPPLLRAPYLSQTLKPLNLWHEAARMSLHVGEEIRRLATLNPRPFLPGNPYGPASVSRPCRPSASHRNLQGIGTNSWCGLLIGFACVCIHIYTYLFYNPEPQTVYTKHTEARLYEHS